VQNTKLMQLQGCEHLNPKESLALASATILEQSIAGYCAQLESRREAESPF
jgi:hypothetical protein